MSPIGITILLTALLTILVYLLYFLAYDDSLCMMISRVRAQTDTITALNVSEQEKLWKEYAHRLETMVLMGTIFITGTFVLLGASVTANDINLRTLLAVIAPLSYLVWLFTNQLPTRIMSDVEVEMRLIINPNGAQGVLRRLYGEKHGNSLMMKIRRNYWLIYIPIIISASIYLILV